LLYLWLDSHFHEILEGLAMVEFTIFTWSNGAAAEARAK
jgi:hypothetical protein